MTGVVYHPRGRADGHSPTVLVERNDAFLHCDRTTPLRPPHPVEPADAEPETHLFASDKARKMWKIQGLSIGLDVQPLAVLP